MRRVPLHYPLEWPASKPRTNDRLFGRYKVNGRDITLAEAQTRVYDAIDAFTRTGNTWVIDPDDCRLKTMFDLRKDGQMRAGQRTPPDVGAVCTFTLIDSDTDLVLPIDKYTKIEQNIAAIAACIDSLRQLWRADAGTFLAAASGLAGLPPPMAMANWRGILGFKQDDHPTLEHVKTRYRKMASLAHSDKGGNDNTMADINRAYEDAKRELS